GVYSESMLLGLTAGALLAARRRQWLAAGLLAGLATLARPMGIVVVVALVAESRAIRNADVNAERRWHAALLKILVPVMVAGAGYLVFAASTFGDPLAVISSQASVRGPMAAPWQPFIDLWQAGPRLHTF